MNKTKTHILVLTGPGFFDQGDLIGTLKARHHSVKTAMVPMDGPSRAIPEFSDADIILLRGPWTASTEEKLLSRLLALRLQPSFEVLKKRMNGVKAPKIFAVGRGALIYFLSSALCPLSQNENVRWKNVFASEGPWIPLTFKDQEFYGLVTSRSYPILPEGQATDSFKPLASYSGEHVVWQHGPSSYLSFVDILACAERNQLLSFGYDNLLKVQTHLEVFELFMGLGP